MNGIKVVYSIDRNSVGDWKLLQKYIFRKNKVYELLESIMKVIYYDEVCTYFRQHFKL